MGKLQNYEQIMQEQIKKRILEDIPEEPTGGAVHYIPHQKVIREETESTMMKIV